MSIATEQPPGGTIHVVQSLDRRANRQDRRTRACGRRASDLPRCATSRRQCGTPPRRMGPYRLDEHKKEVFYNNVQVSLTRKEYELFYLIFSNPGRVFSTHQIAGMLWQGKPEVYLDAKEREIKQLVYTIRKKLKKISSGSEQIENIRGFGYRLRQ